MFWKLILILIGTIHFVSHSEAGISNSKVTETNNINNDEAANNNKNKELHTNNKIAVTNNKAPVDRSEIKARIRTSSMARYGLIPENLVDGTIEDPAESTKFLSKRKAKWTSVILDLARMATTRKLIGLWLSSKLSALKQN